MQELFIVVQLNHNIMFDKNGPIDICTKYGFCEEVVNELMKWHWLMASTANFRIA